MNVKIVDQALVPPLLIAWTRHQYCAPLVRSLDPGLALVVVVFTIGEDIEAFLASWIPQLVAPVTELHEKLGRKVSIVGTLPPTAAPGELRFGTPGGAVGGGTTKLRLAAHAPVPTAFVALTRQWCVLGARSLDGVNEEPEVTTSSSTVEANDELVLT